MIVTVAGALAIVVAIGGSEEPVEAPEANVAPCGGQRRGSAELRDARRASQTAGPLSVPRRPLRGMHRASNGQLYTRMAVLVRGHRYVILSVPLDLRNRVFLYYGHAADNRGRGPSWRFRVPGYAETEFQPCRELAQTVWSGGLRVIGGGPVRLMVTIEGHHASTPLPLGRPGISPPAT